MEGNDGIKRVLVCKTWGRDKPEEVPGATWEAVRDSKNPQNIIGWNLYTGVDTTQKQVDAWRKAVEPGFDVDENSPQENKRMEWINKRLAKGRPLTADSEPNNK